MFDKRASASVIVVMKRLKNGLCACADYPNKDKTVIECMQ